MSRRMPNTDHVYRVVNISTGVHESNEGRVSIVYSGPYAALSTARAEATRQKSSAKRSAAFSHEITVERATGWETV